MNTEKSPEKSDFSLKRVTGLAVVLCVVRCAAYSPEIGLHGLRATGGVHLLQEVFLVLRDLAQIVRAFLHSSLNGGEASASCKLSVGQRSRTLVRLCGANIEAGAIRIGGGFLTVSTDEVRAAGVTILYFGLGKTTFHVVNTGCVFNFSHSLLAMTRVIRCSAAQ